MFCSEHRIHNYSDKPFPIVENYSKFLNTENCSEQPNDKQYSRLTSTHVYEPTATFDTN